MSYQVHKNSYDIRYHHCEKVENVSANKLAPEPRTVLSKPGIQLPCAQQGKTQDNDIREKFRDEVYYEKVWSSCAGVFLSECMLLPLSGQVTMPFTFQAREHIQ